MNIGDHEIGKEPFIIAEVGLNHNGEFARAVEMILAAANAGVDCVKFQTFKADEFCSKGDPLYATFKRCEMPLEAWPQLKATCDQKGLVFLSTPQNPSDLAVLLPLGVQAIKVGSDDFCNFNLLASYARHGLPLILSTGMSDRIDVHNAYSVTLQAECAFLVCTSQYPTPPEEVRIRRVASLRDLVFPSPVGFSDHTVGNMAAVMAVAQGAVIFEKHFTMDHQLMGPDHAWSCEPGELKSWAAAIRQAWTLRGDPHLTISPAEMKQKQKYQRQSGSMIRGQA